MPAWPPFYTYSSNQLLLFPRRRLTDMATLLLSLKLGLMPPAMRPTAGWVRCFTLAPQRRCLGAGGECGYLKGEGMVHGVLIDVHVLVARGGRGFEDDLHGV